MSPVRSDEALLVSLYEFIKAEEILEYNYGLWGEQRNLVRHVANSIELLLKVIHSAGAEYIRPSISLNDLIEASRSSGYLTQEETDDLNALRKAYNEAKHGPKPLEQEMGHFPVLFQRCLDVFIKMGTRHFPEFEEVYRIAQKTFDLRDELEYEEKLRTDVEERKKLFKKVKESLGEVGLWEEFVLRRKRVFYEDRILMGMLLKCDAW